MNLDVQYSEKPKVVPHGYCCRCELPTENSPVGTGQVPTGPEGKIEVVKNIVLCLDCLFLMQDSPRLFWHEGWPNLKKK